MCPDWNWTTEESGQQPNEVLIAEDQTAFDMPPIGKFVEHYVLAIAAFCEEHPDEFHRLKDDAYTKTTFGVNYPFFRERHLVTEKHVDRYRKSPQVVIRGETVLFTNDWYARHYPAFIKYLQATEIIEDEVAETYLASLAEATPTPVSGKGVTKDLVKPIHIGNAQNLFVRNVLGRVRPDEESYGGWLATWEFFDHRCAYCGTALRSFDKDHVYSINYLGLGEHKRGNLVPSCKPCNADKSDQNFRTFLTAKHADNPAEAHTRIARIERFMALRDYAPLAEDARINSKEISALLVEARSKMEALASEYAEKIRKKLLAD